MSSKTIARLRAPIVAAGVAIAVATFALVAVMSSPASAAPAPTASASPSTGLKSGQTVTLSGSNWPANLTGLFVVECANGSGSGACDLTHLGTATTNGSGALSGTFTVRTGTIGSGHCNAGDTCLLGVSNATQTVRSAATIKFASASSPTPTPSTSSTPATSTSTSAASAVSSSAAPTGVDAGYAGPTRRASVTPYVAVAATIGILGMALLGASGLRRRRRTH